MRRLQGVRSDLVSDSQEHVARGLSHFESAEAMLGAHVAVSWAAVAIFYAAHELAHAVFAADDELHPQFRHPSNHSGVDLYKPGTNYTMRRHYSSVERAYRILYGTGTAVRYQGSRPGITRVRNLLDNELASVRRWARERLEHCGHRDLDTFWP